MHTISLKPPTIIKNVNCVRRNKTGLFKILWPEEDIGSEIVTHADGALPWELGRE